MPSVHNSLSWWGQVEGPQMPKDLPSGLHRSGEQEVRQLGLGTSHTLSPCALLPQVLKVDGRVTPTRVRQLASTSPTLALSPTMPAPLLLLLLPHIVNSRQFLSNFVKIVLFLFLSKLCFTVLQAGLGGRGLSAEKPRWTKLRVHRSGEAGQQILMQYLHIVHRRYEDNLC